MNRMNRMTALGLSAAVSMALALSLANANTTNTNTNAKKVELGYVDGANCSISPTTFSTWFKSGSLGKDGMVTFADSVGFPLDNTKCDFYKWGHQMFLWMVSPVAGGIVLDSPIFFDVNFNNSGNAVYLPNTLGEINNSFALRGAKPQNFQPGGQAGGSDTLLSLNDSLVYFGIHANDVYAWFNTAVSNGALPPTTPFPSTQAELDAIVKYAASNGATLSDADALTLELKTAWVDGTTVDDLSKYVTISADVPNYVKTSDTLWTIDPTTPTVQKTLAMVGMHVVGPVQGHPEMVWATFEHRDNVPDNTFYFDSIFGQVPVPYDASGTWNFMTDGGSQDGALTAQMTIDGSTGNVKATTGNTIRQNNVYRVNPWGNAPTPESAENNSELISLNLDIGLMLAMTGDVRANYFQVGSVWSRNGSIPSSPTDQDLIGSLLLANSTMETYHQQGSGNSNMGCFGCHSAETSTGTSHLFSTSNQPLVPPSPSK
ncbi:MAG: hypothetical protein M3Q42_04980 [Pseudomonadota bacterium]|nr:hypothetical protein [Pseudomonadota bacterium]